MEDFSDFFKGFPREEKRRVERGKEERENRRPASMYGLKSIPIISAFGKLSCNFNVDRPVEQPMSNIFFGLKLLRVKIFFMHV